MQVSHVTSRQLAIALRATNRKHGYRLVWNRSPEALNSAQTRFACTIRSSASRIKGARLSGSHPLPGRERRNLSAASWHAHGHFYETLFTIAPDAVIRIGRSGTVITKDGGNWQDWNAGSMMYPAMMSELSIGE